MRRRELTVLLQRNETSGEGTLFTLDRTAARRIGIVVARRDGLTLFAVGDEPSRIPLLHRAVGFGTLADPSQARLDRVLRWYGRLGLPTRVEIAEGAAPPSAERLLLRNGFVREEAVHHVHVLETDRPPAAPEVVGLRVEVATPWRAAEFGRLIRAGFGAAGLMGDLFERASAASVRRIPLARGVSLIARVDGAAAGTAVLWLSPRVGGLYSGSVLEPFRGRGIQRALIAERVRIGLERRRRIFTSQTAGDDPSAHNLHDMGFRLLYRTVYYVSA